jgi:outer membrane protein OmpA-like peptidoglycan-associated protein
MRAMFGPLVPTPPRRPGLPVLAGAALLWLGGCASPPVPVVEAPPVAAVERPTASVGTPRVASAYTWSERLASAARRLRDDLQPAGVTVAQSADQRLWLSLPAEVVFASGRSAIKPPAAPWLDRIAALLREQPRAEVQILGEPDPRSRDDNASRVLALDRAASARDWIVARGVSAHRVSVMGRRTSSQAGAEERRLDIFVGERAVPDR